VRRRLAAIAEWAVYWALALVVVLVIMASHVRCASSSAPVQMFAAQALNGRTGNTINGDPIYFLTYRFADAQGVETTVNDQRVTQHEYFRYWKALATFCVQPHSLQGLRLLPCNLSVPYPYSDQASKGDSK
jgi:hypothetical protein